MNRLISSIFCPCVELLIDFFRVSAFYGSRQQAPNLASKQSSGMFFGATHIPNYSCLLSAFSDGTTDFGDFVTQIKIVLSLSDLVNHPSGDMYR